MSLRKQAAHALKWQAMEIAGRQLLSLLVFTTLARLLSPADFGLVGLVAIYLAFVGMFAEQGIGMALIQRNELDDEHINAAFWFSFASAALLCLVSMGVAGPVARLAGQPQLASLLRWASLTLVINAAGTVQGALFMRDLDFRAAMIRTLVANAVGGGVAIGMAISGHGVWALIAQQLTAAAAGTTFLWTISPWRPRLRFSLLHLWQLMSVSASVFATGLLWFFSARVDQVVIGRFAGAPTLGLYIVGGRLSELARTAIHQPIGAVALPALSRVQSDHERMRNAIYSGMELNALVSFAVLGGLAAVAPSLVPLVFGEQWRAASGLLQLLAIYNLVLGLFVYCHPALLASGGPGRYVFIGGLCAAGSALACIIGIQFDVHTLIWALIGNITFIGILALLFLRQRIGLSPWRYCRPCLVPALAGAMMYVSVGLTRSALEIKLAAWPNLLAQVVTGAGVYLAVILAMAPGRVVALREVVQHAVTRQADPA